MRKHRKRVLPSEGCCVPTTGVTGAFVGSFCVATGVLVVGFDVVGDIVFCVVAPLVIGSAVVTEQVTLLG